MLKYILGTLILFGVAFGGGYYFFSKSKTNNTSNRTAVDLIGEYDEFYSQINNYLTNSFDKYLRKESESSYRFVFVVDGSQLTDVPLTGVEGAVAKRAVKANYFDINGKPQSVVVATIIQLKSGELISTGDIGHATTQEKIQTSEQEYPGMHLDKNKGDIGSARIFLDPTKSSFLLWGITQEDIEEFIASPGIRVYQEYIANNAKSLEQFIDSGDSTGLDILLPIALSKDVRNIYDQ